MQRAYLHAGTAALLVTALAVLPGAAPPPVDPSTVTAMPMINPPPSAPRVFSIEQLDAMLAPVALYPDAVLTPVLMAASDPLQVVMAGRWIADPAHAALKGDALASAVADEDWDPAAKALVPYPTVLRLLSDHLDWTMQLAYAMADQPDLVLDSLQRLRRQALEVNPDAISGPLAAQRAGATVAIVPANPPGIAVPASDPAVYGSWPYSGRPPVAISAAAAPPVEPPAALRDLCGFDWSQGVITVNLKRWNALNGNRPAVTLPVWHPHQVYALTGRLDVSLGAYPLPPGGPVGRPAPVSGIPADAIGRNIVTVPAALVHRPAVTAVHAIMPLPPPPAHAVASSAGGARPVQIHLAPMPAVMETTRADALSDLPAGTEALQFEARGAQSRDPQATPGTHQEMARLAP